MTKRIGMLAAAAALLVAGTAGAQHILINLIAEKVIGRYQSATCEQLWEARGKPKSADEQQFVQFLRGDPSARTEFLNKIAGPVANKMFECDLIP